MQQSKAPTGLQLAVVVPVHEARLHTRPDPRIRQRRAPGRRHHRQGAARGVVARCSATGVTIICVGLYWHNLNTLN